MWLCNIRESVNLTEPRCPLTVFPSLHGDNSQILVTGCYEAQNFPDAVLMIFAPLKPLSTLQMSPCHFLTPHLLKKKAWPFWSGIWVPDGNPDHFPSIFLLHFDTRLVLDLCSFSPPWFGGVGSPDQHPSKATGPVCISIAQNWHHRSVYPREGP